MIERCAFVAITTEKLARARAFWEGALELAVVECGEDHFIVDAGGTRLCVDSADGDLHRMGGTDPIVGLIVNDVAKALAALATRGVLAEKGPLKGRGGAWAVIRDPDGHAVVLTEFD